MEWLYSTSVVDLDSAWVDDEEVMWNTGSAAECPSAGHYLEGYHAGLLCDKVRIRAMEPPFPDLDLIVQVQYGGGSWHTKHDGYVPELEMFEIAISPARILTGMRVANNKAHWLWLYVMQFGKIQRFAKVGVSMSRPFMVSVG